MVYITSSGVSIPQSTDAFSPGAQFKTWADGEAPFDYFTSVALDTDRTAITTPKLRSGLYCHVQATGQLWVYGGSSWSKVGATGMSTIIPSAVAGGTADSAGLITFTSSSGVNIDGCFTSSYRKFKVELSVQTLSSAVVYLQLRAASTTDTSSVYDKQRFLASSSSASAGQQLAQARWDMGVAAFTGYSVITMDLANVAQAEATVGRIRNDTTPNPMTTAGGYQDSTVLHRTTSAFDGLAIVASSGNITGWAKVYGYV